MTEIETLNVNIAGRDREPEIIHHQAQHDPDAVARSPSQRGLNATQPRIADQDGQSPQVDQLSWHVARELGAIPTDACGAPSVVRNGESPSATGPLAGTPPTSEAEHSNEICHPRNILYFRDIFLI